jgi:hypothetical protein
MKFRNFDTGEEYFEQKLKGFSQTVGTLPVLGAEKISEMARTKDFEGWVSVEYEKRIRRNKRAFLIVSRDETKRLRMTIDKRVVLKDGYQTVPYGYESESENFSWPA